MSVAAVAALCCCTGGRHHAVDRAERSCACLRQDGAMTDGYYSRPLPEMGLRDVIRDFRASLRNAESIYDYQISFIRAEGHGPIIELYLFVASASDRRLRAYFHLPPTDSPTASQARAELATLVVLTNWGSFPEPVHRVDLIWDSETRSWQEWHSTPAGGIDRSGTYELIWQIWVGAAALWFLGKLADAYVSRLADRLVESTFKAAARISLRRRRHERYRVSIEVPEGITVIVLPPDLSDDAKEAFIDLDPTATEIRGKTLYWDEEHCVWVPRNK
jgi:hypothetical protein